VKPKLHAFGVDDIGRRLLPSHTFGVDEGSCSKPESFQASATGQLLASAEVPYSEKLGFSRNEREHLLFGKQDFRDACLVYQEYAKNNQK